MGTKVSSYQDLKVWQRAMALAEDCYRHTKRFPREEMFGFTSQIRRAAVSVAANIAEGFAREQARTFIQFLRIAQGSLKELETHLILATRVGFDGENGCRPLLIQTDQLGKMLRVLIRRLQQRER